MSARIDIPANERGIIRVFSLSMDASAARALKEQPEALAAALGTGEGALDAEQVEVFPVSDLEGIGLSGYLAAGNAVPEDQLAPDRVKLDKLGGWVLILYSRAFADRATTLAPAPALTLIGTYGAARTDWTATERVTADSAKPYSAPPETVEKKKPSDAAMSGRIATLVLIVLGLFTWAMIWIAG
ncbi:MAG: hypothetical protein AAFQ19_13355 [Pseudomonadota bacterium]